MRVVVVDASALVALGNKNDDQHRRAANFWKSVADENALLVVSDYVLDETYTLLMARGLSLDTIEKFHKLIESSIEQGAMRLHMMNKKLFDSAWLWFKKFFEQGASFTDCVVYEIGRDVKADCIFTFDDHFIKIGCTVKP